LPLAKSTESVKCRTESVQDGMLSGISYQIFSRKKFHRLLSVIVLNKGMK